MSGGNLFMENGRKARALIFELGSFTMKEFVEKLRKRIPEGKSMYIDRWGVPVSQLLEDWSDLGILHNDYGRYTVTDKHKQ